MAASLWTDDGIYDAQVGVCRPRRDWGHDRRRDAQSYIHAGCAHVLTMPYITVEGDTAVATCYGQLFRRDARTSASGG